MFNILGTVSIENVALKKQSPANKLVRADMAELLFAGDCFEFKLLPRRRTYFEL